MIFLVHLHTLMILGLCSCLTGLLGPGLSACNCPSSWCSPYWSTQWCWWASGFDACLEISLVLGGRGQSWMATPPPGRWLNAVLTVQMPRLSACTCQSAKDRSAGTPPRWGGGQGHRARPALPARPFRDSSHSPSLSCLFVEYPWCPPHKHVVRVKCTAHIVRTLNRIRQMLSVPCLRWWHADIGVSAFNHLGKFGRVHLYSQFSGEGIPENLKKETFYDVWTPSDQSCKEGGPACKQRLLVYSPVACSPAPGTAISWPGHSQVFACCCVWSAY